MLLSEHFDLSEFADSQTAIRKGINNTPSDAVVANLTRVAQTLEEVRKVLGVPLLISSGYRSPALNKAIGGARNSAHLLGLAADFTAPAFGTPKAVMRALLKAGIKFDQLIYEGTWVHLGLAEGALRNQVLTAHFTSDGVTYTTGLV